MSNRQNTIFNIGTLIKRALFGLLGQDCLLCAAHSQSGLLCAGCAAELPCLFAAHSCPQCASPSPGGLTCGRCLGRPPHYDRSTAAWRYAFPADRLLQSFKYGARLALAGFCAEHIVLAGDLHTDAFRAKPLHIDLIVPMPLHPRRLSARGFNQALEIARPLAHTLQIPIEAAALARLRDTAAQAGLPLTERVKNVRGAFACKRDLTGLRIAVVDDVMTSGATLDEVAKTLKRAGAVRVENWVAARTLTHER